MKRILIILLLLFAVRSQAQFNNPFDWFGVRRIITPVNPDISTAPVYWLASNSTIMYGIDPYGNLFKTTNGYDWDLDNFTGKADIVSNYVKGDSIYAGTYDSGLYVSFDNGSNWAKTAFGDSTVAGIVVIGSDIFVYGTYNGVFYSSDGGNNWSNIGVNDTINNNHIIWISKFNTTLIIGTDYSYGAWNDGIYLTTNKGVNWTYTTPGGTGGVNWTCQNGDDLYSATDFQEQLPDEGIFKSTNGGFNWTQVKDSIAGNTLCADTNGYVYEGSYLDGVFASTNDGLTWESRDLESESIYCMTIFGDSVYCGTNLGVKTTPLIVTPSYKAYVQRSLDFIGHADSTGKILDTAQRHWYNDSLFTMLIDSGLIGQTRAGDSIVALYCYGLVYGKDTLITRTNLLNPWQYKSFKIGTITDTDTGFISDGSGSSYISSGFNNRSDSTIAKKYSGGALIYSLTNIQMDDYVDFGQTSTSLNCFMQLRLSDNSSSQGWNGSGALSLSDILSSREVFAISRTSSTKNNIMINGIFQGELTETGVAIANAVFKFGYAPRCILWVAITSGLSVTKMRGLQNILNYASKGRGHNIY